MFKVGDSIRPKNSSIEPPLEVESGVCSEETGVCDPGVESSTPQSTDGYCEAPPEDVSSDVTLQKPAVTGVLWTAADRDSFLHFQVGDQIRVRHTDGGTTAVARVTSVSDSEVSIHFSKSYSYLVPKEYVGGQVFSIAQATERFTGEGWNVIRPTLEFGRMENRPIATFGEERTEKADQVAAKAEQKKILERIKERSKNPIERVKMQLEARLGELFAELQELEMEYQTWEDQSKLVYWQGDGWRLETDKWYLDDPFVYLMALDSDVLMNPNVDFKDASAGRTQRKRNEFLGKIRALRRRIQETRALHQKIETNGVVSLPEQLQPKDLRDAIELQHLVDLGLAGRNEEQLDIKLDLARQLHKEEKYEEALALASGAYLSYASMSVPGLGSVLVGPDGEPSLTARLNKLMEDGVIDCDIPIHTASDIDLENWWKDSLRFYPASQYPGALVDYAKTPPILLADLRLEIERLHVLEAVNGDALIRAREIRDEMSSLKPWVSLAKGLKMINHFQEGAKEILFDPSTAAMIAAGIIIGPMSEYFFEEALYAGFSRLSAGLVRIAASGISFHAVTNTLNYGLDPRMVDWSPRAFWGSVQTFGVLHGVNMMYGRFAQATFLRAAESRPVLTRMLYRTGAFGAEVTGLAASSILPKVMDPNYKFTREELMADIKHSVQMALAFRAYHLVQAKPEQKNRGLYSKSSERALKNLEKQAATFDIKPNQSNLEALQEAIARVREFEEKSHDEMQGAADQQLENGVITKQQHDKIRWQIRAERKGKDKYWSAIEEGVQVVAAVNLHEMGEAQAREKLLDGAPPAEQAVHADGSVAGGGKKGRTIVPKKGPGLETADEKGGGRPEGPGKGSQGGEAKSAPRKSVAEKTFSRAELDFFPHLDRHLISSEAAGTKVDVSSLGELARRIEGVVDSKTGEVTPFEIPKDVNDSLWQKDDRGNIYMLLTVRFDGELVQPGVVEQAHLSSSQKDQVQVQARTTPNGTYYLPMYAGEQVRTKEATLIVYIHDGDARQVPREGGGEKWVSGKEEMDAFAVEGMPGGRFKNPKVVTIIAGPSARHPSDYLLQHMTLPRLRGKDGEGLVSREVCDRLESTIHNMMDVEEAGQIAKVWADVLQVELDTGRSSKPEELGGVIANLRQNAEWGEGFNERYAFVGKGEAHPAPLGKAAESLPPEVRKARENLLKLQLSLKSEAAPAPTNLSPQIKKFTGWAGGLVGKAEKVAQKATPKVEEKVPEVEFLKREPLERLETESFQPQVGEHKVPGYYGAEVSLGERFDPMVRRAAADPAASEGLLIKSAEDLHLTIVNHNDMVALGEKLFEEAAKSDLSLSELSKGKQRKKTRELVKARLAEVTGNEGMAVSPEGMEVTGLGSAKGEEGQTVFFASVAWPEAQRIRQELGLGEADFHVTLASNKSAVDGKSGQPNGIPLDVHGVSKKANLEAFGKVEHLAESRVPRAAIEAAASEAFEVSASVAAAGSELAVSPKFPDMVKWASGLIARAEKLGDATLRARAKALQVEAENFVVGNEGAMTGKLGKLSRELGGKEKAAKAASGKPSKAKHAASLPFSDAQFAEGFDGLLKDKIISAEERRDLERYLAMPAARRAIQTRLETTVKTHESDPVASYTQLRGLFFELSRIEKMSEARGIDPTSIQGKEATPIEFIGVNKKGDSKKKESTIQNDVPIVDGHIWESKKYSRMEAGSTVQVQNQALKYQAAVVSGRAAIQEMGREAALEAGFFDAATMEISGNVDRGFIEWASHRAPNVEILYVLELPNGQEIAFPLKEARPIKGESSAPRSLRRIYPPRFPADQQSRKILEGVQRALELGVFPEVFSKDVLTEVDVNASALSQAIKDAIKEAGCDPSKIKDLEVYKAYEVLVGEKRLRVLGDIAERKTPNRPSLFEESITDAVVARELRKIHSYLEEAPTVTQMQYKVTGEKLERVEAEFARALREIAGNEVRRLEIEVVSVQAARTKMGYTGPREGYPLDPLHIYMDIIKKINKETAKVQKRKKGQELDPLASSRDYGDAKKYPTAAQVAAKFRDGDFNVKRTTVKVVYPEGTKEDVLVEKEFNISTDEKSSHQEKLARLQEKVQNENLKLLAEKGLTAWRITQAKEKLDGLNRALGEEQKIVPKGAPKDARAKISEKYAGLIRDAKVELMEAYKTVLGEPAFEAAVATVEAPVSDNVRKFIYIVDAEGEMRLFEESLDVNAAERPTHSVLAGGQSIFAGGEIHVRTVEGPEGKLVAEVEFLNNGSGHYRPPAAENLTYVENLLSAAGFDVSGARKEQTVWRHVCIDTPISELWHNNFFTNGE